MVNGLRDDVELTYTLSSGGDPIPFVQNRLDQGQDVYIAEGLRTESLALSRYYTLVPLILQAIASPVTRYLPPPELKDLLVVRRSVFRVLEERPSMGVREVPEGSDKGVVFGDKITLRGLVIGSTAVARGSSLPLEYYWQLDRDIDQNLQFQATFFDEQGRAPLKQGYRVWFHAYAIGGGTHPTSEMEPGQRTVESYNTLVPRQVDPGTYNLHLRVYDSGDQTRELSPSLQTNGNGVVVGQVTVY